MKIKNKIIGLFASIAIMSFAAQTNVLAQAKNFAGAGIALSGSYAGGTLELSNSTTSVNVGENTTLLGADINYSFPVDGNFFIGIGATYDFGKTKVGSLTESGDKLAFTVKDHYSAYIQPSYAVSSNTALFAKLGYNEGKGQLTVTSGTGYGASVSKNFSGYGYGFGVKTLVNNNTYVQAEAGLIQYDKETSGTVGFKPEVVLGTISIGYKF